MQNLTALKENLAWEFPKGIEGGVQLGKPRESIH
jgi:hypothetical protein